MKQFISPLLKFVAAASLAATAYADYPIVSHRYLADPTVLVHDGRVYLYCSNDDENVGSADYLMQSLVCVSSSDMKNWTDHGEAFRVPENASWADRSWAPGVIARNDQFYLYFGNGGSGIGVATSDSPIGPYNDPLGELLISHGTPGASGENMWLFDPYAFIDDNEQAYLYFGGNGESNVRIIELNDDMISVGGAAISLTAPGFFEAAWMHKRNDIYYFSYSTNPSNGLRIDYMTSDNATTGFEYAGIVAGQPPSNNNNNHHGIFKLGEEWYHVFHNRFVANEAGDPPGFLRNLGIESFTYNEDGTIQQITYTRDDLVQAHALNPYAKVEGETMASQSGIEVEPCSEGGMNLTDLSNGDWVQIRGVDFRLGADSFNARVASSIGGTIELRLDSPTGTLVGTCQISDTGGLNSWDSVSCDIDKTEAKGGHDLYVFFSGEADVELFKLNWYQFQEAQLPPVTTIGVDISAVSNSMLQITWSETAETTSYAIKRSLVSEGPYETIADTVTETSYADSDLKKDVDYFYVIAASNEGGVGPDSIPATGSTAPNFEEWVADVFPNESDQRVIGPNADTDQDGLPNLLEYFMGTSPHQPESTQLSLTVDEANNLMLRYRRSQSLASTTSSIQKSDNLANWVETGLIVENIEQSEGFDTFEVLIQTKTTPLYVRLAVNTF